VRLGRRLGGNGWAQPSKSLLNRSLVTEQSYGSCISPVGVFSNVELSFSNNRVRSISLRLVIPSCPAACRAAWRGLLPVAILTCSILGRANNLGAVETAMRPASDFYVQHRADLPSAQR
jgi:hypothetical protein